MKLTNKFIIFITVITFVLLLMLLSGNSCSDGFLSSSIGSRGACSHHGGVSFFSKIKVPLIFSITGLIWYFLNTLTKNKKNTCENINTNYSDKNGVDVTLTKYNQDKFIETKLQDKKIAKGKAKDTSKKCPKCRAKLVLRVAKKGKNPGNKFWGCSRYPRCRGTRKYVEESTSNSDNRN
ncbi:TPA: topoisomerase DNA-binding C4 zinc finger domain-containing protein [Neisseria subflava]